jgi:hypothetical protein
MTNENDAEGPHTITNLNPLPSLLTSSPKLQVASPLSENHSPRHQVSDLFTN